VGELPGSTEEYNPRGVTIEAMEIMNKNTVWSQPVSLTFRFTPVEVAVSVCKMLGHCDEWRKRPRTALRTRNQHCFPFAFFFCSSTPVSVYFPYHVATEFLSDKNATRITGSASGMINCTLDYVRSWPCHSSRPFYILFFSTVSDSFPVTYIETLQRRSRQKLHQLKCWSFCRLQ
jgi:hypothetical protein